MPISILRRPAVLIVITALCSSISLPLAAQDAEPRLTEMIQSIQTDALRFSILIQVVGDPVVDPDDDDPRGVSLAAARFRLTGRLDSGFQYLLQTNFAGSPSLLDARVGWSTSPRFAVHAGRFKAPFSRELLTYAGSIDFVNRSRAVEAISPGRQLGLQLSGREGRMGWSVGTFNGSRSDLPGDPMLGVARLEVASGAESSVQWTVGVARRTIRG